MTNSLRRTPAVLGLLALGAVGLLLGPGALAEDGAAARQAPGTWVYDVRVVRVDVTESAVLEVAPPWQPAGAAGASTAATWADLLAGLKGRGRTTILMDQRVTTTNGVETAFQQERRRPILALRTRSDKTEVWETTYVETGTTGQLVAAPDVLRYGIDVRWEERPTADKATPLGSASWKGSHSNVTAGETLVLSYRQQQVAEATALPGLEIYVFVTGWPVPAK